MFRTIIRTPRTSKIYIGRFNYFIQIIVLIWLCCNSYSWIFRIKCSFFVNCITQNKFGTDQRYANYGAIQECIKRINLYFKGAGFVQKVAFPMIGAGLAGGDWQIIERIIERNSKNFQPIVYDFTP